LKCLAASSRYFEGCYLRDRLESLIDHVPGCGKIPLYRKECWLPSNFS